MKRDVMILIADDDAGHARLIQRNLARSGLPNPIQRFEDGQQVLDFFADKGTGRHQATSYLRLLDIRMPKIDGVEVL